MTSERARPECDVRLRNALAAGTEQGSGTLNFRLKFCHSTGIARSGGGVRASTTSHA